MNVGTVATIGTIVFFGVYGVSHFYPFTNSDLILAVAALFIAVAAAITSYPRNRQ